MPQRHAPAGKPSAVWARHYAAEIFSQTRPQATSHCATSPAFHTWAKVIQRIAGEESDLSDDITALFGAASVDFTVIVCYAETSNAAVHNVSVRLANLFTFVDTKCHADPLGRRIGFGSGDTVTSAVKFDGLVVDCPVSCNFSYPCHCLPLTAPTEVEVSLNNGCPGPFLLTKGNAFVTGDFGCDWMHVTGDLGGGYHYFIYLRLRTVSLGSPIQADVWICEYSESSENLFQALFTFVASSPGDCQATAAGTLTDVVPPNTGVICTLHGATVTVTCRR
jgi:hypothetical protein